MNNRAISNLTLQLQKSLDSNYDVINMEAVLFVIQQLENTTITKEQLETTRLAKYINELRRRTPCERLARRAKNLLKKWRDIFMPAIHQQSATTAPTTGPGAAIATVSGHSTRSQSRQQQQQSSQIQTPHAVPTGSGGGGGGGVASNFPANISSLTKVSTGSANNNNSSRNSNSSLSNGGFSQQHQQLPQAAPKVDSIKLRGSRTVSPACDRNKQNYPPHNNATQPTSFANVLSTQHLIQHTFPLASSSASTAFNHDRTESPVPPQPGLQQQQPGHQRRRQSPVPPLDFELSQLRTHATSSKSQNLANGENNSLAGMPSVMDDFRDSNSLIADIAASADDIQSNQELISFATCAPNLNVGDISSPASGHRKNKKHKKEKKRNKQSPDKPYSTSEAGLMAAHQKMSANNSQGLTSFLNLYGEDIRPSGEDELHNVATGGTLFPPHDSLSSSSMSRFPSNISTNTMTMHNSRMLPNNEVIDSEPPTPSDSDLTFAGKFKSSSGNTGLTTISENPSHLLLMKKSFSDSKDSSDVVVVESRSCSPFTTVQMCLEDSCSSSSRAIMLAEPINSNANSNQELLVIEQKSMQPQRLQQLSLGHQEQALSCNSAPAGVSVPASSSLQGNQQQPQPGPVVAAAAVVPPGPKKRGRKKGSRGYDAVIAQTHAFLNAFERPRLFLGSKKVKTTKELLADIQNRKLGSSAASSPTLAVSRPSVSPSTCSEASFQSDLTNTRASLLNPSPDLLGGSISVNRRQSDVDEIDSTTDSNEVGTTAAARSAITQATNIQKVEDDDKSRKQLSSVDDYLTKLMKCLPPIDYSKRESIDPDFMCTCTIRIAEPAVTVTVLSPKNEMNMLEADRVDAAAVHRELRTSGPPPVSTSAQSSSTVVNIPVVVVPVPPPPPPPQPPAQPSKSSPKKPVKSIFDLDYDEDNDPLQSFVAAAKLRISEQAAEQSDNITLNRDADDHGDVSGKFIAVNSVGKSNHPSNSNSQDINVATNQASAFQRQSISIPNGGFFDSSTAPEVAPLNFPQYEAVEDPDCVAKHQYEVKTNRITEYHVNTLHNRFMASVNGNWSTAVPFTIDHRKRLRRYLAKKNRNRTANTNTTEGDASSINQPKNEPPSTSTLLSNPEFVDLIQATGDDSSDDDDKLYDRVVPHYDHINMDRIPKDFSFIKFTKNYMKEKHRWFRGERGGETDAVAKVTAAEFGDTNKTNAGDEVRKTKKRKRSRTTMSGKDASGKSDENDDEVKSERKRKHQRRKKQRKLRDSNLDTSTYVDTNLSRIEKKDDDGGKGEVDVGSGNSRSDIVSSATTRMMKPNTFSDTTDQQPTSVLHNFPEFRSMLQDQTISDAASLKLEESSVVDLQSNNHQQVTTIAFMQKDHDDDDNDLDQDKIICSSRVAVGGNEEKDVVDVTLIESSSNSDSYYSNLVNNSNSDKAKDIQQLSSVATSFAIENDGSISHDSYCSGYRDADHRNVESHTATTAGDNIEGGGIADEDADEELEYDLYGDPDEDCDEDEHINDEEHEVVTHDMTSSTSTTSQQHIVLTIKKKIPKLAASHINVDGNAVGKQSPPPRMWTTYSKQGDDQLSIITSSTPTSIKIRRKNNAERPKQTTEYGQQSHQHRSDCLNSDENYTDILDNNNIKNGRDSPPSHGDDSTDVIKASIISNDGDYATSTMTVPQSFQVDQETLAEAAADNQITRSMNDIERIDPEQHQRDQLDHPPTSIEPQLKKVQPTDQQSSVDISMQAADGNQINYDQFNGQQYDNDNKLPEVVIPDEKDDDHDEEQKKLLAKNNGLLESFNKISDENLLGLRINPPSSAPTAKATDTTIISAKTIKPTSSQAQQLLEKYRVEEFKEWHEVLQVPSYNDELLTILPYVVID